MCYLYPHPSLRGPRQQFGTRARAPGEMERIEIALSKVSRRSRNTLGVVVIHSEEVQLLSCHYESMLRFQSVEEVWFDFVRILGI